MTWGASGLVVTFGPVTALDGVDATFTPGRVHAVIGGDGSGKSTLLRVLAGVRPAEGGVVRRPPRGHIGYVATDGGFFPDLTVEENLEFVAGAHRLGGQAWRQRSDRLLERAGIAPFRDRLAGVLSGGQKRKLAGSMALLAEPELLVLDEVTTGVDPFSRLEIWHLAAEAAAAGAAVVAATAYLDEAERAEEVLLLHQGRVLDSGSPSSVTDRVPGTIDDVDEPDDPARAWRQGARWRQWRPEGTRRPDQRIRLEDAAIVRELIADEGDPR